MNNGGPTATHALRFPSPAQNAGTATSAPALDQRGFARSGTVDIGAFEAQPVTLLPSVIPDATVPVPYTATTFTLTDGLGAVTFSITGTLPTGMSLSGGVLSGTPTQGGSFPITITGTDSNNFAASRNFTLRVLSGGYGSSPTPGGTINVGSTPLGTAVSSGALTAAETSDGTLLVSNPVIGGAHPGDFSVVAPSFPFTIADGGLAQTITLRFNPAATGTRTATLSFTTNDPLRPTVTYTLTGSASGRPVITSPLAVTPVPPFAGQVATFSVGSSDPENDPLTFMFDYGDGSTGSGATHVYALPGFYVASVTVSDGIGSATSQLVFLVVSAATPPGPAIVTAVTRLDATFRFGGGREVCNIAGVIPGLPMGFVFPGKTLGLDIGGAVVSFTLDDKLYGASGDSRIKLRPRFIRSGAKFTKQFSGGDAPFKAKIVGVLSDKWANEGITGAAVLKLKITMPVTIVLDGKKYFDVTTPLVKANAGGRGRFRFTRK